MLPPGVQFSSLVNHCLYSVFVSLSFYFLVFLSARVSAFFIFFWCRQIFLKQFLSVCWFCKLFDKALVVALALGLAMCLQLSIYIFCIYVSFLSIIIYKTMYIFHRENLRHLDYNDMKLEGKKYNLFIDNCLLRDMLVAI
jgi:hypothetical protein